MKKFFFRLDTLLSLRVAKEVRIQRELSFQNRKLSEIREKKETIEKQIASLMEEIRRKREGNERSFEEMYTQILDHLNASLTQVFSSENSQEKFIEELKARLKRVAIERKVIEKIKEKEYSQWQSHVFDAKEHELDEISIRTE